MRFNFKSCSASYTRAAPEAERSIEVHEAWLLLCGFACVARAKILGCAFAGRVTCTSTARACARKHVSSAGGVGTCALGISYGLEGQGNPAITGPGS